MACLPPLDDLADGIVDCPPGDGPPAFQQLGMVDFLDEQSGPPGRSTPGTDQETGGWSWSVHWW
jgi:hypothetical protein